MKKLILIFMAIALCAYLLVGCEGEPAVNEDVSYESSFVIVEFGSSYNIVYHKDTKVMYTVSCSSYNCGSFCLLVNADGTPMIWEGE